MQVRSFRFNSVLAKVILAAAPVLCLATSSFGYIDLAPTLSKIMGDSRKISVVEVTAFDRAKHVVVFKDVRSLKGTLSAEVVEHDVSTLLGTGARGPIPAPILEWATPGARAVLFASGNTALICFGEGWYQANRDGDGNWIMGKERPDLPLAFYGRVSVLAEGVEAMLAGKNATLTVVAHGAESEAASFDLALNRQSLRGAVRLERIRANSTMPATAMSVSANPAYFIGSGQVDEHDLPQLLERLGSKEDMVRAEAAEDIQALGRKGQPALSAVAKLLADKSAKVRFAAAAVVLGLSPTDAASVTVLNQGMASSNAAERRMAADAAGLTGKAGSAFAEKLAALLKDPDESVRVVALRSISTLGPAAAKAMDAVTPLLDNPEMAGDAADALGRMESAARPTLKKLATLLTSDQLSVQWAAVRAMSLIGGDDARPAAEYMINALKNKPTEAEGYNMMIYLSLLGPVAKDAGPAIQGAGIKNPVLPSATMWAISPQLTLPWQVSMGGFGGGRGGRGGGGGGGGGGGPGGGGVNIGTLIYQDYMKGLGERMRPLAPFLANKIMDNTAGTIPDWGYKILTAGPDLALGVLTPHLADADQVMRERATVALGYMGNSALPAKAQVQAAMAKASTDREKRLLEWCLRQMETD